MPHKLFQNVLDDVSYRISRFLTCLSWGLLTSVLPSIGGLRTTSMVSKHHTPHKVQFLDRDRNMGKWPACLAMPCHDDTVYGLYGQAILHQLGCLLGFPKKQWDYYYNAMFTIYQQVQDFAATVEHALLLCPCKSNVEDPSNWRTHHVWWSIPSVACFCLTI